MPRLVYLVLILIMIYKVNKNDFMGHPTRVSLFGKRYGMFSPGRAHLVLPLYMSVFVSIFISMFYVKWCSNQFKPSSGSEKDTRRELYHKKKNNVRDRYSESRKFKPVFLVSKKPLDIPQMTLEELEIVMRKVPKLQALDPSFGVDFAFRDRLINYVHSFDINKVLVNKIMALFESISLLALNLYQAHTRSHQLSILLMWVQNRFASDKSLLLNMTELVCWFSHLKPSDLTSTMDSLNSLWQGAVTCETFTKLFVSNKNLNNQEAPLSFNPSAYEEPRVGPETVGTPGVDQPSIFTYTNSESVIRFKALIQMFVDAGMCSIFGYNFDFGKSSGILDWVNITTHRFEMVEFACSTIMYFVERGYAAYDRKNIKYLFFANDFVHAELEFRELENELKSMYNGDGDGDVSAINQLEKKLVKLCAIYKKDLTKAKPSQKFILSDRIGKINHLIMETKRLQKKVGQRKAPYVCLFIGMPGVGKSWCTGTVAPSLLTAIKKPSDPYYIRTINQSDDFDTMIDNNTLCIQVDDIANGKPTFEKKNPTDCILRFVNNVMCPANKARLEEKGGVFISPLIVIVTTNIKGVNASCYSMCPVSILRRFDDHISVHCDPKYMTDQKLDVTKWPEFNRRVGLPPLTFTVERVTGSLNAANELVPVYTVPTWEKDDGSQILMKDIDWSVLEPYLASRAQSKMAIQAQYLRQLKKTENPMKCICGISYPLCKVHERFMHAIQTPVLRWVYRRRKQEELVKQYVDRKGVPCKFGDKGCVLRSAHWRKKFRISNYTSKATAFVLGLSGPPLEVRWTDGRYIWIDDSMGNQNRKFRDLSVVPCTSCHTIQPSSARLEPEPQVQVPSQGVVLFDPDIPELFSDSDSEPDFGSLPSVSDDDHYDPSLHDLGNVPIPRHLYIDTDGTSDDESLTDEEIAWQGYLDYEDNYNALNPSAGEETVDRDKVLKDWMILVDWWSYSRDMFRSMMDLKKLEETHEAVCRLVFYGCAEYIPINFYDQPDCVVSPEIDGFFSRRQLARDEMVNRVQAYCYFKHSITVARTEAARLEMACEDESDDDDEEEVNQFNRCCAILELGKTKVLLFPFQFGSWLTHTSGSVLTGTISGFCFSVISCLFSVSMCLTISNLVLGIFASLFVSIFWGIFGVAAYFGSTKWRLIKYITSFKDAHIKISHYSRKVLKYKYHVVFGAIAVMAIGTMWYRSKKRKDNGLEPSGSTISVPVPRINERANNYWTVNKVNVSEACGVAGYQNTPDELLNVLDPCVLRVRVYPKGVKSVVTSSGSTCQTTCAILMSGGLLIVPKHLVADKMGCLIHAMRSEPGKIRNNAEWILCEKDCYIIPDTDFAVLYTSSLGAAKDLRRYLPTKVCKDKMRVKWFLRDKASSGKFPIVRGSAEAKYDETTWVNTVGTYKGYNFSLVGEDGKQIKSEDGWCMSPLVSATNPSCIHSFFLAGAGTVQRSAPFLASYVDEARSHFENLGRILLPSSGTFSPPEILTDTPGSRSPLSHLDKCEEEEVSFEYYGSRIGMTRRFIGKVQNTPFASHMKDVFSCAWTWCSPLNLGNWKPWWTNLFSMGVKVKPFDPEILDIAQDDLRSSLLQTCSDWKGFEGETFSEVVFPVDMEVAINGVPGVAGCDRVKMNTSAGYPFCCSKSKVINEIPDDKYPCGYRLEPCTEVIEQVDEIMNCAKSDVRSNIVFTASVKDEPTLPTKEKVRVFAGCPVAYLICVRMMTCMLVKFMTDNHLAFNTVAGANAHDYDWTLIGQYLAEYSVTNCIAGDYSDYDKKILAMLMVKAVELTCDMLRLAGYTEEMILVCKNLMLESCYPIYEWNGDFINMCGSNPSGQPLTVWLNNLVNLLYQRYVFYSFYGKEHRFDECVRILVLGDDNIMSVKPGFEKYNHTSIQKVLGDLGMKYTMADKKTESVPYIPLEETSLLKRRFVWSSELECYLAPIEEKSIFRCLSSHMLANGSNSEAVVEHCGSMVENALAEWFYFGRQVYEDRVDKILRLLARTNMLEFSPKVLTYDDQVMAFKSRVLESRCLFGIDPKMSWVKDFVFVEPEIAMAMNPSGGYCGYKLVPEYGFREVFVGRKFETHVDVGVILSNSRTLTIVDCYVTSDIYAVPKLFEPKCWVDTFRELHLGIHHGSYFDDDDPRVLYRRGEWVMVRQDKRLTEIHLGSISGDKKTLPPYGSSEWLDMFDMYVGHCHEHNSYGSCLDCRYCYAEYLCCKRKGEEYLAGKNMPSVLLEFDRIFLQQGFWKSNYG